MLVQFYQPYTLSPNRLDRYLAAGWFRNSTLLFRSRVLCLDGEMLDVVNIRLPLKEYIFPARMQKLWRKNSTAFRIEYGPAKIDKAKNQLYHAHKQRFSGFIYTNLKQFLQSDGPNNAFDTRQVEVFEGDKLIAFSFFDVGQKSISSIIGIYSSEYSRHSLGIFTMLAEIIYAREHGIQFYYPGFIFNRPTPFDYKLKLGDYQHYDWKSKTWIPSPELAGRIMSGDTIMAKIRLLETRLKESGLTFTRKIYPYFSLGYIDNRVEPFVKAPVLLFLHADTPGDWIAVEYIFDEEVYMLSKVTYCSTFDSIIEQQERMGKPRHEEELSQVCKYTEILGTSGDIESIMSLILSTGSDQDAL